MAKQYLYDEGGVSYLWDGTPGQDREYVRPQDLAGVEDFISGRDTGPIMNTLTTATERVMRGINKFVSEDNQIDWPVSEVKLRAMNESNPKTTIAGDMLPYAAALPAFTKGPLVGAAITGTLAELLADPGNEERDLALSMAGPLAGKVASKTPFLRKWLANPKNARVDRNVTAAKGKVAEDFSEVANTDAAMYADMIADATDRGDTAAVKALTKQWNQLRKALVSGEKQTAKRAADNVDKTLKPGVEDMFVPGLLAPAPDMYDLLQERYFKNENK